MCNSLGIQSILNEPTDPLAIECGAIINWGPTRISTLRYWVLGTGYWVLGHTSVVNLRLGKRIVTSS